MQDLDNNKNTAGTSPGPRPRKRPGSGGEGGGREIRRRKPSSPQPTLLHVGAQEGLADLTRRVLEPEGWKVTRASTVASALENLERQTFDIALIDYRLPDGTCEPVLELLDKCHLGTAKVITTENPQAKHFSHLSRFVTTYLPKPYKPEELELTIQNVWKRWRAASGRASEEETTSQEETTSDHPQGHTDTRGQSRTGPGQTKEPGLTPARHLHPLAAEMRDAPPQPHEALRAGDGRGGSGLRHWFILDEDTLTAHLNGKRLELKPGVFRLLYHLLDQVDAVVTYEELGIAARGNRPVEPASQRSLSRMASELRRAINAAGPKLLIRILNIRDRGYRITIEDPEGQPRAGEMDGSHE